MAVERDVKSRNMNFAKVEGGGGERLIGRGAFIWINTVVRLKLYMALDSEHITHSEAMQKLHQIFRVIISCLAHLAQSTWTGLIYLNLITY